MIQKIVNPVWNQRKRQVIIFAFMKGSGYRVINGFLNSTLLSLIEFWQKKGKAIAYTVNKGALA